MSENTVLLSQALAYVNALYRELSTENGAAMPGTQNQVVGFILADRALREVVAAWGRDAAIDEAGTAPPAVLPQDPAYDRIRACLAAAIDRAGPRP